MEHIQRTAHWEKIYETKTMTEVSWFQEKPTASLSIIEKLQLPKNAQIIDIGGGDSFLVDYLLKMGFENLSVLDISAKAIQKAKTRLKDIVNEVNWIVSDIVEFNPPITYDLWHDRAAFHFLTQDADIDNYVKLASNSINKNGILILATFSENGPTKCSGIDIKQYNDEMISTLFYESFKKLDSFTFNHQTPFNTMQNFVYVVLQKK